MFAGAVANIKKTARLGGFLFFLVQDLLRVGYHAEYGVKAVVGFEAEVAGFGGEPPPTSPWGVGWQLECRITALAGGCDHLCGFVVQVGAIIDAGYR